MISLSIAHINKNKKKYPETDSGRDCDNLKEFANVFDIYDHLNLHGMAD